jgi:hypothetical protein
MVPESSRKADRAVPRQQPRQGWVYFNLDQVTDDGKMFARNILNDIQVERPKLHLLRRLSEDMHLLPSASPRKAFDAVGRFEERLAGYEDDDLFLLMFCAGRENIYVRESLSSWRMNDWSCRGRLEWQSRA